MTQKVQLQRVVKLLWILHPLAHRMMKRNLKEDFSSSKVQPVQQQRPVLTRVEQACDEMVCVPIMIGENYLSDSFNHLLIFFRKFANRT